MADYETLYNNLKKIVLENRNAILGINANAKQTSDLTIASIPLAGSELVRLIQGGVSVQTTADELKGSATGDANVQSDWSVTDNLLDTFIDNKPTNLSQFTNDIGAGLGEANVNADWNALSGDSFISNKPNIAVKWIEIDDALVYKGTNTGGTVQVGDLIMRYPTTSRFIHAKVNALPYTSDGNLSFFQDITVI